MIITFLFFIIGSGSFLYFSKKKIIQLANNKNKTSVKKISSIKEMISSIREHSEEISQKKMLIQTIYHLIKK
jgi:hypothetical protein